jgi:hypothetical protein
MTSPMSHGSPYASDLKRGTMVGSWAMIGRELMAGSGWHEQS